MSENSIRVRQDDEGAGTFDVATDQIGGKDYPIYKISFGSLGSQTLVDTDNPLPTKTTQSNGVPNEFTKITSNASTVLISKGGQNKIDFFPRIINEQQESAREIQSTITSTNTVNQIIKISKDNMSALLVNLESAASVSIDDFESYANSAALQAAWIATGALATLETVTVFAGSQAMSLPTTNVLDEWERTSAPQDYTGYTGAFRAYFSHVFSQQKLAVYIKDSVGNNKSFTIIQEAANAWCNCSVNESAMVENPANTLDTDITDITKIGYRVITKKLGGTVIIDDLASIPPGGEVEIKWWNMGSEIPVPGVTSINDGVQYDQIGGAAASSYFLQLLGGKRTYHIEEFTAGLDKAVPGTKVLTVNNYYLLELKYVDTDVSVYGADTSFNNNYYTNGFACTAPDEATPITAIGEFSDLMFGIMSAQEVYFTKVGWRFNAEPNGNSSIIVVLEDINMDVTDVVIDHEAAPEQSFDTDISLRPMHLDVGGKLEFYYDDDPLDSVTNVRGEVQFLYVPPVVNG